MAKKAPLLYDRELYQSGTSQLVFTEKEARQEYARLRRLANKRLAALERAGLSEARSLRNYPASFESMRGSSEREVRRALEDVSRFMSLKTTTVRGIQSTQRKALDTLHKHGYDFVNKDNLESFGRFMEAARQHTYNKKAFDSERAAAYYKDYEEMILEQQEEMEEMMDDWEDLEDYEPAAPDESERVSRPKRPKAAAKTRAQLREEKAARERRQRRLESRKAQQRRQQRGRRK